MKMIASNIAPSAWLVVASIPSNVVPSPSRFHPTPHPLASSDSNGYKVRIRQAETHTISSHHLVDRTVVSVSVAVSRFVAAPPPHRTVSSPRNVCAKRSDLSPKRGVPKSQLFSAPPHSPLLGCLPLALKKVFPPPLALQRYEPKVHAAWVAIYRGDW